MKVNHPVGILRLPALLSSLLFLLPTSDPVAKRHPSGEQEFLAQVRSARKEAKGKILLGKREAMVAWERARLFIYTHAKRGSVTDRGNRISGRIAPFTWTARQRLKKGRVEIEPLCQSSRLFHIDDAKRNSLLFYHYVKTGELPYPDLIRPYGVALNAFDFPVPGSTRAEIALQVDTLLRIYARDGEWLRACDDVRVAATDYLEELDAIRFNESGRMTEGRWRERWTLRRCGRPVPYLVTYTADGYGEAMVEVGPEP